MDPRDARLRRCAQVAQALQVDLLLLIGSRARGEERPDSDWDFAALAATDLLSLDASLGAAVGDARVDVVDLARGGGLVRFHAARDGVLVHEARPGLHLAFQLQAATFWCDNEALIAREYRGVLAGIAP